MTNPVVEINKKSKNFTQKKNLANLFDFKQGTF